MGVFAGCEALAPRLEQIRPALCVFGHIHEARGAFIREWEDDGKRTVYVNAAVQAGSYNNRDKEVGRLGSFLDVGDIADLTPSSACSEDRTEDTRSTSCRSSSI